MTGCGFGPFHAHWPDWTALDPLLRANLHAHGDFPKWQRALENLPAVDAQSAAYGDTVSVDGPITASARTVLNDALLSLHPWRKGPFSLFGIQIDSEWRSDIKWRRVAPHVDLKGARVLDVGCGNGYYGWRMLEAGAEFVLGIDPTVLYGMQHRAIDHCIGDHRNQVLPLALEALPEALCGERFDAVFSMGVIYHRRDPLDHLQRLAQCLVPGGKAVVESLIVDGPATLQPAGRYARMRNVWLVPTPGDLRGWMANAGFIDIRVVDSTRTTTAEQRTTEWMRYDSLACALDPSDSTRTIEGHPAPRRCVLTARKA